jgi:hypothetical protein
MQEGLRKEWSAANVGVQSQPLELVAAPGGKYGGRHGQLAGTHCATEDMPIVHVSQLKHMIKYNSCPVTRADARSPCNSLEGEEGVSCPCKGHSRCATPHTPSPAPLPCASAGIQVAGAEVASESYRLTYVTGDKLGAGTDATVRTEFTDVRGTRWQPAFAQVSASVGDTSDHGRRSYDMVLASTGQLHAVVCCTWLLNIPVTIVAPPHCTLLHVYLAAATSLCLVIYIFIRCLNCHSFADQGHV